MPDYDKEVLCYNGISPIVFFWMNRSCIKNIFEQKTVDENLQSEKLSYNALQTLSMLFPPCDGSSENTIISLGCLIWPKLFIDCHYTKKSDELKDYKQESSYISWLSEYLLSSPQETQHNIIINLAPYMKESDNTEHLMSDIIHCQDHLQKVESFWHLWYELFDIVEGLCALQIETLKDARNKHEYYGRGLDEIVTTFSLAFPWWEKNIKAWHTLKVENEPFFNKLATKLGYHPCVLYSVARVLNTIGFDFLDHGINWLFTIIENNKHLVEISLQVNTEYYIEEYMQRYILAHRNDIKRNSTMRKKVIDILSFLVDRGSTCGFMLRESIT